MNSRIWKRLLAGIESYRAGIERLIFAVAALGVIDVTHLQVQKARGFEGGCSGLESIGKAAGAGGSAASGSGGFNCEAVTSGIGSELFGVSNITWGFVFYGSLISATLLMALGRPLVRKWIHGGRAALLTGGFFYSGYLTYLQFGVLDNLCALCLVSAVLAATMFGLQSVVVMQGKWHPGALKDMISKKLRSRQLRLFARVGTVAILLIGADLTYFSGWASVPAQAEDSIEEKCEVADKPPVADGGGTLLGKNDITAGGDESAPVTIIEYFDPNCPHCADFHEVMKPVVKEKEETVQIVYKPFPLSGESLPEIQALYFADERGKFEEMLARQYATEGKRSISKGQLRAIAKEVGIDGEKMISQIESGAYREKILEDRKGAINVGVRSTPTVIINGKFAKKRSEECLRSYIKRAETGSL